MDLVDERAPHDRAAPSLRLALIVAGVCGAMGFCYGFADTAPGPALAMGIRVMPLLALAGWIQADARQRGVGLMHDWGMIGYLLLPFSLPWYAVRTRGRAAGWRLTAGLCLLVFAPAVGGVLGVLVALLVGRST